MPLSMCTYIRMWYVVLYLTYAPVLLIFSNAVPCYCHCMTRVFIVRCWNCSFLCEIFTFVWFQFQLFAWLIFVWTELMRFVVMWWWAKRCAARFSDQKLITIWICYSNFTSIIIYFHQDCFSLMIIVAIWNYRDRIVGFISCNGRSWYERWR